MRRSLLRNYIAHPLQNTQGGFENMRNLRKLTAVVVAIALVLTSMATAFAASTTYEFEAQATVLKDLGIWTGNASGDLMLGKELTRAEGAVLVLKTVLGKTEADMEAADVTSIDTFADAAKVPSWAEGWIALAVEAGVVKGSDNKLNAAAPLLGKDLASMFMNALGFSAENDYAKAVELLAAKATITSISAKIPAGDALLRDAASAIVTDALTAKAKDAKETVIVKYVGSDASLKAIAEKAGLIAVAPAEVTVESIKALNAKEIEVKFNSDMDKDSAKDINFYEVKDKGTTVVTLTSGAIDLVDSKTAVITLNNTFDSRLTNSTTAKVKVKKDIKAASGKKLAADVEKEVAVQDGAIPTVTKVEATGEKTIKVTFSEPVYGGSNTDVLAGNNFAVKSGTYTYYVQNAKLSGKTITLSLGTSLIEGPVVVTVNANGAENTITNNIQDYVGYRVFKGDSTFTYAKDTSVSVVTVKEAKQNSIKLGFSKPIKANNLRLFHSVKDVAAYQSTPVSIAVGTYVDEITFGFSNKIPAGTVKLFLVNDTTTGNEMVDGYGIKVPDQVLTTEIVVDVTGPTVSSTELKTNTGFELVFDEELDSTEAYKVSNYTFKTVTDNKDVPFSIEYTASTKKVFLRASLTDATQYQVVVKNATDLAGNKMAAEAPFTFTTGDNTNPSVKDADCYAVNADGKIFIVFSEPMNEAQMLDKSNYVVATNGAAYISLGDDDKVIKISEKSVLIDLKDGVTVLNPNVKISSALTDLAGKKLTTSSGLLDNTVVTAIAQETVTVASAELVGVRKIKIKFNKELGVFDNTELGVQVTPSATGVATTSAVVIQAIESQAVVDGKTEIVAVVDTDLNTDATYSATPSAIEIVTKAVTANTKSTSGTVLAPNKTVAVTDKLAPNVVKYDASTDVKDVYKVISSFAAGNVNKTSTGSITIYFSEKMKQLTLSTLTFTVDGYNVTSATAHTDGRVVLNITATADPATGKPTVTQALPLADDNDNVFAAGGVWQSR